MREVTEYSQGTFCWPELVASDSKVAKKFYSGLFGWRSNDHPIGDDQVYALMRINEKDVAALYQMNEQQKSKGVPTHWASYISVKSVDETAEKAKSLKAEILAPPMDVFDAGRMALFQDPTGAVFAIWQAGKHIGSRLQEGHGTLCWTELATNNTEKALEFYTALFGWKSRVENMGPIKYTTFMNGEEPVGGMLQMTEEWGDIPPHWMVYFNVNDCDASVEEAKKQGAEVKVPPTDIPQVGRFSVLQDPQGAAFSVIKMIHQKG